MAGGRIHADFIIPKNIYTLCVCCGHSKTKNTRKKLAREGSPVPRPLSLLHPQHRCFCSRRVTFDSIKNVILDIHFVVVYPPYTPILRFFLLYSLYNLHFEKCILTRNVSTVILLVDNFKCACVFVCVCPCAVNH